MTMEALSPRVRRGIPWGLIACRFALGPGMLAAVAAHAPPGVFVLLLTAALLSDVLDGVLARRWRTVTAALRVADSWADMIFYLCTALAIARRDPALVSQLRAPLAVTLALYAARWAQDLRKYGRPASYHATLSRLSGGVLFAACIAAFCSFHAALFFWCAFAVGTLCHLEAMAISALLPVWTHDVAGLRDALRRRSTAA